MTEDPGTATMSNHVSVKSLTVEGLHGRQRLAVEFDRGLNIFHGKNGSGKTTMLHVLANLFEGDLERFCHLQFTTIKVTTSNDQIIEISQGQPRDQPPTVRLTLNGEAAGSVTRGEKLSPATAGALRAALRGRPVYLPAFRSVLEAITRTSAAPLAASDEDSKRDVERIVEALIAEQRASSRRRYGMHYMRTRAEALAHKTLLCRRWFGPFVPLVRYPSLWEVADELSEEVQHAYMDLSATDQKTVSTVFTNVLEAVLAGNRAPPDGEDPAELLASVKKHLEALDPDNTEVGVIYKQLRDLLSTSDAVSASGTNVHAIIKVYEKALADRATSQERLFAKLRTFERSVNRFLAEEGRHLILDNRLGHAWARHFGPQSQWVELPGKRRAGFSALSSGERHVVTLLFAATHVSTADGVVLIDEPELSLHVEWQRIVLTELEKQAEGRQIIACTHAPEVAAEHLDVFKRLAPEPWLPAQEEPCSESPDDPAPDGE